MGRKFKGERLEWSEENLQFAIKSINRNIRHVSVPVAWRPYNETNRLAGHCHNAAGSLYMLFGPEYLEIWRGQGQTITDGYHFWCVRKDTREIIDITAGQYSTPYDYTKGNKSVMLGFEPYNNAKKIYQYTLHDYSQRD